MKPDITERFAVNEGLDEFLATLPENPNLEAWGPVLESLYRAHPESSLYDEGSIVRLRGDHAFDGVHAQRVPDHKPVRDASHIREQDPEDVKYFL